MAEVLGPFPAGARVPGSAPRRSLARAFALPALLAIAAVFAACASRPAPKAVPAGPPAHPGGTLFSTVRCADTPLGREWAKLRADAAARFPGLSLSMVEDLHITVVFVGPGWRVEDVDRIRGLALVAPREAATFRPEAVRLGRNAHVVAVEMHDAPESWSADVVAAKAEMNRLGLKSPEGYDGVFRPHVTLASARNSPPDADETAALEELRAWIARKVVAAPARWTVAIGPGTPVRLWLAGTERPPGAPEYVDLEERLGRR